MAVYVTSDLHGLELSRLKELLLKVNFSDKDWLYILGDVVDRENDGGIEILCWLLEQPNVQLILGNHEAMLLSCEFVFDEITDESIEKMDKNKMDLLLNYMRNGGDVTLKSMKELRSKSPETVSDVIEYLKECPIYETVSVGNNDFLLVHSGIEDFKTDKRLSEYKAEQFLWARPRLTDDYFDDIITVFGHTPTLSYGNSYKGKILRTKTWINIDVGVPYGNPPALLRLDDLAEFYDPI